MVLFLFVQVCLTTANVVMIQVKVTIRSSATDNNQSGDETSESDVSDVSWDEEAYSAPIRAVLVPIPPSLARPWTSQWTPQARPGRPHACHWQ